jgi:hypothetical protein
MQRSEIRDSLRTQPRIALRSIRASQINASGCLKTEYAQKQKRPADADRL